MQISHQYWKSLYCEYFILIIKSNFIGLLGGLSIFLLSSDVIEIKNENQREGFKSVEFSQRCRK